MAREEQKFPILPFIGIAVLIFGWFFTISYGCMYIITQPLKEYKATHAAFYYIEGEPQQVNISELIHAYETNALKANTRYGGIHVRVRARFIQALESEDVLYFRIGDQDTWSSKSLRCRLSASSAMLFKLNRGDVIEVGGILQGANNFENVLLLKPYITLIKRETNKTPE